MQHLIPLDPSEPRCRMADPSRCSCRGRCARHQAALPQGAPVMDYSVQAYGGTVLCPGFLSTATVSKEPAKPKVHEAPKGIA